MICTVQRFTVNLNTQAPGGNYLIDNELMLIMLTCTCALILQGHMQAGQMNEHKLLEASCVFV